MGKDSTIFLLCVLRAGTRHKMAFEEWGVGSEMFVDANAIDYVPGTPPGVVVFIYILASSDTSCYCPWP